MATTEHYRTYTGQVRLEKPRSRAFEAGVLGATIATIEGVTVASTFLICAFFYHFLVLDVGFVSIRYDLYFIFAVVLGLAYGLLSARAAFGYFDGESQSFEAVSASIIDWTIAFAVTLLVAFLFGKIGDLSRVSLTSAYVIGAFHVLALRSTIRSILAERITGGRLRFRKIAVVGHKVDVLSFLLENDLWRHGQQLTGTLYLDDLEDGREALKKAVSTFAGDAVRKKTDTVVIATDIAKLSALDTLQPELKRYALNVAYALFSEKRDFHFLDVVPIGPSNTLRIQKKPLNSAAVLVKRGLDIAGASFGILLLSPLLLAVAVAIKLDSPGPAIYRQKRRGFNGEPFTILKFRTMTVMESGEAMAQAVRNDARFTRIGRFLRAWSIDELPQLFNVFNGSMSLVGPRPHAISHDDQLDRQIEQYAYRRRIKPGITGWAQVNGFRGETTTIEQIENRIRYDLYYIERWSVLLDIWVLMLTVLSPATHRNSF